MPRAYITYRVEVDVDDAKDLEEVAEALKDYLYDANNTITYDCDPEILDVTYDFEEIEA